MHTSPPSSSYRPILGHQQTNLNAHKLFRTLQSKQLLRPSFKGDLPPSSTHLLTSGNRDSVADPSSVFASNSRNSPLEQIISHSLNFPCQDWFNRMLRTDGWAPTFELRSLKPTGNLRITLPKCDPTHTLLSAAGVDPTQDHRLALLQFYARPCNHLTPNHFSLVAQLLRTPFPRRIPPTGRLGATLFTSPLSALIIAHPCPLGQSFHRRP